MSILLKREYPILSLVPNEDHTSKEGYAVKANSTKAQLVTADTDSPIGVVLDGGPTTGRSAVLLADCSQGTCRVKLDATPGTVTLGTYLTITASATFKQAVSTKTMCARALEAGAANELIEAVLFRPVAAP